MSRSLSIALILVGSAILGSLIWLHFYLVGNAHVDTLGRMHDLNQLLIEQKSNTLRWKYQATQEFFSDWSRTRYNKILQVWEKGEKAQKEITKLSYPQNWPTDKFSGNHSVHKYQVLREAILLELREVVTAITVVYTENAKAFDFSEKMLEKRLAHIEKIYQNAAIKTQPEKIGPLNNEVDFLALTGLVCLEELLQSASSFYTGCGMTIDRYFPVLIDGFKTASDGRTVTTRVAIVTYTSGIDPTTVELSVNGQRLKIGYNGEAAYSFLPKNGKEQELKMECKVTNPLTGESQRGSSVYIYKR